MESHDVLPSNKPSVFFVGLSKSLRNKKTLEVYDLKGFDILFGAEERT